MKNRRLIFVLLPILAILLLFAVATFWGTPRLVEVSPAPNDAAVPAGASLRLTFSRSMQPDTVTERLTIDPPQTGSFRWEDDTLVFTPSQPWPSGKAVKVHLAPGARSDTTLSFPLRNEKSWSFTIGHPRLAYLYPPDGTANVYILNLLSGSTQQLTTSQAGVLEFSLTSSGRSLFYSVKNAEGGSDLYQVDTPGEGEGLLQAGRTPTLVLKCGQAACRSPQVSPDGSFLAFEKTAPTGSSQPNFPQVWLLSMPLGTAPPQSAESPQRLAGDPSHQTDQPAWSSDGQLAYYDTNLAAYVIYDPRSQQMTRFPNQTGQSGAWDPTGRYFIAPEISYVKAGDPSKTGLDMIANSHLIQFDRQTGQTTDLTQAEDLEDASPAFSPDGASLALARKSLDIKSWTPGRQLWIQPSDGSSPRQLTNDPSYNYYEFAWSPESDQLAYVRFNQTVMIEPPELWVINPDGSAAQRLVTGGYSPQWIP
jgi:Tol biopolymer transport system component